MFLFFFRDIRHTVQCYQDGFNKSCAVDPIVRLMNATSHDSSSLRFQYEPDCTLHSSPVKSGKRDVISPTHIDHTLPTVPQNNNRIKQKLTPDNEPITGGAAVFGVSWTVSLNIALIFLYATVSRR